MPSSIQGPEGELYYLEIITEGQDSTADLDLVLSETIEASFESSSGKKGILKIVVSENEMDYSWIDLESGSECILISKEDESGFDISEDCPLDWTNASFIGEEGIYGPRGEEYTQVIAQ